MKTVQDHKIPIALILTFLFFGSASSSCICGLGTPFNDDGISKRKLQSSESYPWVVGLTGRPNKHNKYGRCDGAIINERIIISDEACFDYDETVLVVGTHSDLGSAINIGRGVVKKYRSDFLLVMMESDINFASTVSPICLMNDDVINGNLNNNIIAPYSGKSGPYRGLMEILPNDNPACKKINNNMNVDSDKICAAIKDVTPYCPPLFGQPLAVYINSSWFLLGVNYDHPQCQENGEASTFTKITRNLYEAISASMRGNTSLCTPVDPTTTTESPTTATDNPTITTESPTTTTERPTTITESHTTTTEGPMTTTEHPTTTIESQTTITENPTITTNSQKTTTESQTTTTESPTTATENPTITTESQTTTTEGPMTATEHPTTTIESQTTTTESQTTTTESPTITTESPTTTTESPTTTTEHPTTTTESPTTTTESRTITTEGPMTTLEHQTTIESQTTTIESQTTTIESQTKTTESPTTTTESQKTTTESQTTSTKSPTTTTDNPTTTTESPTTTTTESPTTTNGISSQCDLTCFFDQFLSFLKGESLTMKCLNGFCKFKDSGLSLCDLLSVLAQAIKSSG